MTMRQSVMTMLVMFLGLSIGVAPGVAQEAEQTLMDEVKAVLTQHDQAFRLLAKIICPYHRLICYP